MANKKEAGVEIIVGLVMGVLILLYIVAKFVFHLI